MYRYTNPNPKGKHVPDCVVRALCIALNLNWYDVYDSLYIVGRKEADMENSDAVWGKLLYYMGFTPFTLPNHCPNCITIREFAERFPFGTFIIGTGSHAVAVVNGDWYDIWDSGNELATFFWVIDR